MARMYAVDRRVYIGDEARPMYNASVFGMALYYVPVDDLAALGRRRFLAQAMAIALFVIALVGYAQHRWSEWWVASALTGSPLAAAYVGRWVREHYQAVSNPAVSSLVHQRLFQDTDPAVAVLFYFALTLPETIKWLHREIALPTLAIATIAVTLQLISRFVLWRERRSLPIEERAS